jgi:hypothetical protein
MPGPNRPPSSAPSSTPSHGWMTYVLFDMIAYAERNKLADVVEELTQAAERIAPLVVSTEAEPATDIAEPLCDVIAFPLRG